MSTVLLSNASQSVADLSAFMTGADATRGAQYGAGGIASRVRSIWSHALQRASVDSAVFWRVVASATASSLRRELDIFAPNAVVVSDDAASSSFLRSMNTRAPTHRQMLHHTWWSAFSAFHTAAGRTLDLPRRARPCNSGNVEEQDRGRVLDFYESRSHGLWVCESPERSMRGRRAPQARTHAHCALLRLTVSGRAGGES